MTERLVALESKIAMLEHSVDTLSGELAAHQRTIDRLQRDVDALVQFLKKGRSNEGGEPIEPHDTRPPHWGGS
jgi:uncharacterized coiled-coil protein SlyX